MKALHARRRQRGMISTFIAIIVLLVTLLAAIALMRSVDTSNTVAGTLAFKQSVVHEAEVAYKDALDHQNQFNGVGLGESNLANIGYYASMQPLNSQGIPMALAAGTGGKSVSVPGSPDSVAYTIERLCPSAGPALTVAPNQCLVPSATLTGGSSTGNQGGFGAGAVAGYRLSVRVVGPKNIVSYVQTVLH